MKKQETDTEKRKMGVYKTTNLINGKFYIGKQHSKENKEKISEKIKKYREIKNA